MDPLAHTLTGATLAEAGLKRLTPLAATTALIGANLPDIDAATYLIDGDLSLGVRRGCSHGLLAMALLPLLLAGAVLAFDRFWRRRRNPDAPPVKPGPILAVSFIATLSHPVLDWMNAYGIRLLMPFSSRWFYGDTLFIVDPWVWLVLAAAVALGWTRRRLPAALWSGAAVVVGGFVATSEVAPAPARALVVVGLAVLAAIRIADRGARIDTRRVARVALIVLVVYIGGMFAGTQLARRQVRAWVEARGITVNDVAALPVAANSLARDVIVISPDRYHFVALDWLASEPVRWSGEPVRKNGPTPVTEAALRAPAVRGLAQWLRFPSFDADPRGDGWRVIVRDVRFWRRERAIGRGLGTAVVELDGRLKATEATEATTATEAGAGP